MAGKPGMHKRSYMRADAVERIRERIKNSQIAERLVKHVLGEVEMSQSQVQAATTLLRKIMPDLASQEITDKREGWLDVMKKVAELDKSHVQPQQSSAAMEQSDSDSIVRETNESADGRNLH